jgi:protoheme IX farnesyltransferase
MERTRLRPVAVGTIGAGSATAFGIALAAIGSVILFLYVSPLTAACALFGGAFYDLVYTPLKRITVHNTVLGGVAGAMPPLVGWVAVTGSLDSVMAWTMFGIMFLWQPAHFWPLSLLIQRDYAAAGFKMLPAEQGERTTVRATWRWTLVTVVATFVPLATGDAGVVYAVGIVIANAYLLRRMWALVAADRARGTDESIAEPLVGSGSSPGRSAATRAFLGSMVWLAIVFLALVVDALVR